MSATAIMALALASTQAGAGGCAFPAAQAQAASAEDMTALMSRYIGKFRSPSKQFDNSDKEYFFTIEYRWFDRSQSVARWEVEMAIPDDDQTIANAEGYYGFDHGHGRIYVFGVFGNGTTGRGEMGVFDLADGSRSVWAKSVDAGGVTTHVQDMFEMIDADSFRNRTLICRSDVGEWQEIGGDVYTRVVGD